ncbi:DNA-processing protein DprA [Rossellomorea aquimaris]|uniref:DNA-processing protein DprA n=1 Tax=Rossellomorea aquimaris TaxID=189382 RepID=UPI0007D0A8CA|nr:DNA-processing protein DprA [Rossellomorea aquimaris]
MNTNREILFHLHHCRGIGIRGMKKLLTSSNLPSIFNLSSTTLQNILQTTAANTEIFFKDLHSFPSAKYMKIYSENNIKWITILDDEYPFLLKNVYDPPLIFFYIGNKNLLQASKKLAIIGSRKSTLYTTKILQELIPKLVEKQVIIISGLAKGADTIAHTLTIDNGGGTIGVLGGGFNHIYPKQNAPLAKKMKEEQLLISEYPPYVKPEKWHFPFRNRIISGLSNAVFITEAEKKSGTFITADYALNEGRDVLCVPGPIFDHLSQGTNALIQEGAKMVLSIEDIFSELRV